MGAGRFPRGHQVSSKSSFTQVLESQAIRNERGISHVSLAEWEAQQVALNRTLSSEFELLLPREGELVTTWLGGQARSESQRKL